MFTSRLFLIFDCKELLMETGGVYASKESMRIIFPVFNVNAQSQKRKIPTVNKKHTRATLLDSDPFDEFSIRIPESRHSNLRFHNSVLLFFLQSHKQGFNWVKSKLRKRNNYLETDLGDESYRRFSTTATCHTWPSLITFSTILLADHVWQAANRYAALAASQLESVC